MMMAAKPSFEFGSFRLDPAERQLLCEDEPVALTPKCFDLLVVLVENNGHLVEKEELLRRLWPNQFVEESNLSFNISALRKALGEGRNEQRFIETVPKKGFRFVAPVTVHYDSERGLVGKDETRTERSKSDEEFEKAATEVHEVAPTPVVVATKKLSRQSLRLRIAVGVLAVGILGLLVYGLSRRLAVTTADQPVKTIAVLPFKPLSAESRDESLEMGMAETLITRLSNINQIVVRPMSAVRKYTDLQQDPIKAGQELQTDAILDGSVQKVGDRVRVTVRLTSVRNGASLWAQQFDENFTDIFKVQDSISEKVATALTVKLSGVEKERLGKRYTDNPEAYELYLQGQYLFTRRGKDLNKSIDCFQQAIEKDPKFALAYVGIAEAQMNLVGFNQIPANEGWPKAIAALTKALELDNTLAEAHNTLAEVKYQYEFDWVGAEKEFKKAIDLNSNLSLVRLAFGWYLMSLGRFDEASREMERAQELDPRSMAINRARGRLLYFMRQYDRALQHCQKILELEPDSGANHWAFAQVYEQKGMYSDAVREYSQLTIVDGVRLTPEDMKAAQEAFQVSGWPGYVRTRNALLLHQPKDVFVSPISIASNYARLGDRDQTFAWFEKAIDERASGVAQLKIWPMFDQFRSDPRYPKLLQRMNLNP